jgi:hypothetical protein
MMMKLLLFHAVPRLERVHPLEGGLFRRKIPARPPAGHGAGEPSCVLWALHLGDRVQARSLCRHVLASIAVR